MSESGAVGKWAREEVEVFCVANLINCALEADEENMVMDFHCTVADGGLKVGVNGAVKLGVKVGVKIGL